MIPMRAAALLLSCTTISASATTVTPSGDVSYEGSYSADSLYVVAVDALLDRDASGFDWPVGATGPDPVTNGDILGWFDGQRDPVFVLASAYVPGLDFPLPTGEITGTVTMIGSQTEVTIVASPLIVLDAPGEAETTVTASGPYAILGVYPGGWYVRGISEQGDVCYMDPSCTTSPLVVVTLGEIRTGIDIDFSPLPVEGRSWGGMKSLYR